MRPGQITACSGSSSFCSQAPAVCLSTHASTARIANLAEGALITTDQRTSLWELARLFLKLGTTAFGGPAAHIAMLQQEVVERRGWISHAEFLDHLGASNLIPGPTSTELVIHIGRKRGGRAGLLIAGTCFILPAAVVVAILAWAYVATPIAGGFRSSLWCQTCRHRHHPAGPVEAWTHRDQRRVAGNCRPRNIIPRHCRCESLACADRW